VNFETSIGFAKKILIFQMNDLGKNFRKVTLGVPRTQMDFFSLFNDFNF
jgi:hypothetical protein